MPDTPNNRRDDVRATVALQWTEGAPANVQLQDAMIDIETLGTKPGSAILSIGAVMFGAAGLGEQFYVPINLQSCVDVGLTADVSTIAWWMRQSDEARAAAFPVSAMPLEQALCAFHDWFLDQGGKRPWCHGATFDVPLLDAAFKACGLAAPWEFWNVRDTRTLYDLAGVKVDRTKGTHHNALDDAITQAEAAVKAIGILASGPMPTNLNGVTIAEAKLYRDLTGDALMLGYDCVAAALEALRRTPTSAAARDVLAERRRQVDGEGMTNDADDRYHAAELPRAAASYILNGANDEAPSIWPWAISWWKPRDARANYVRAAALLLAEIERLDRAAQAEKGGAK